ncbi:MAG TPA: septum formation family protein [Candidatus Limnocylindrales bacterium]|nr:septum formation family protein [Candidatus Limnocylindrales bacterium]
MARFLSGIGVRIAIVALIAVVGFLFRDRLTGNAGELQVGDCFDDPAETQDIGDVQHHPCTEAHTAEAFYVGQLPGGDDAPFPTEADLFAFASGSCAPAFASYTGTSIDASPALDFSMFYPTEAGWADGDREATCYAVRVDGTAMTQSVRAASP